MDLLARISAARGVEQRYSVDEWAQDWMDQLGYGGVSGLGLNQTYPRQSIEEIRQELPAYMAALQRCPPAFGAQLVRGLVLSGARFAFRNRSWTKTPRRIWSSTALAPLERPWPNATTGELISRMEWHAGLAGNAYAHRRSSRLRVLRPDWVGIMYGSQLEPDNPMHALDGELLGYVYRQGGIHSGYGELEILSPGDVSHWSPIPDPLSPGLGMSWVTPAIREMQVDRAATQHKLQFFANGATPNLVVSGIPAKNKAQFDRIVEMMEENHAGVHNAYKTLYLTAGADVTIVGSDLSKIDMKAIQGSGETRISVLSRVPAALLGISEGLAGSALSSGGFPSARRMFADTWVYPTLQDLAAAMTPMVTVPSDSELWFTADDIPLLREDGKDAAEIQSTQATTINSLVTAGYKPDSVIVALKANDWGLLVHSGMYSVQLQPLGAAAAPPKPRTET
ncbi:phage portal protein [Kribbella sp. NPDC051718]|uniref:phage portal protein n=1 Tax=Kribbella sp. NPDC051718 TaxID=3155168 RepID=UPI0034391927